MRRTALVSACLRLGLRAAAVPCGGPFSPEIARLSPAQLRSTPGRRSQALPGAPAALSSCSPYSSIPAFSHFISLNRSGEFGPWPPVRRAIAVGDLSSGGTLELSIQYDDTWSDGPVGPTVFHGNGERVLISLVAHQPSFFGMGGDTETHVITAPASKVLGAKDKLLEDYQGQVMMRTEDIGAACAFDDRFLVGMGDCYLWQQDVDVNTQKFVFIGAAGQVGTITSVDVSPDQRTIYVGTSFGTVQRFGVQDELGTGFITNLPLRDERRYLFLDTFEPMLW